MSFQAEFCKALEELETDRKFVVDKWYRKEVGYGHSYSVCVCVCVRGRKRERAREREREVMFVCVCSVVVWNVCRVQESVAYKNMTYLITFCRNQSS